MVERRIVNPNVARSNRAGGATLKEYNEPRPNSRYFREGVETQVDNDMRRLDQVGRELQGEIVEQERPTTLWDNEGVIILNNGGILYTNQTAGVMCNHPTARGKFQPMAVPNEIENYVCRSTFESGGILYPEDVEDLNQLFVKYNMPLQAIEGHAAEEAWLPVMYYGQESILTWGNCD